MMEGFEARIRVRLEELKGAQEEIGAKIKQCDEQLNNWAKDRAVHIGNAQVVAGGINELEGLLIPAKEMDKPVPNPIGEPTPEVPPTPEPVPE
jgi:hypothetical protein